MTVSKLHPKLSNVEVVQFISLLTTAALFLILTSAYLHALYHDFYTEERKNVSWRKNAPKITPVYRRLQHLIAVPMCAYPLSCTVAAFLLVQGGAASYYGMYLVSSICFVVAKTSQ